MAKLSNELIAMSGRRYALHVPKRIRFSYKDEKRPVSQRIVLYWQYNKNGDGFNTMDGYKNY